MNILLVSNGYPPTALGGVEIYVHDLAQALSEKGHSITVFCRETDHSVPDYTVTNEQQENIRIVRVVNDHKELSYFRQTFVDAEIEGIFANLLNELSPDLVHFNHLIALSARLPLIAAENKIPSVITLHDYWPICHRVRLINRYDTVCPGPMMGGDCATCVFESRPSTSPKLRNILFSSRVYRLARKLVSARVRGYLRERLLPERSRLPSQISPQEAFEERHTLFAQSILASQRIIVPSNYVRAQFSNNGYPEDRIETLPLGIASWENPAIQPTPKDTITFAAIGTLYSIKGIDILIETFKNTIGDGIRLKIYGREDTAPEYAHKLRQQAQGDERISFMGPFSPDQREQIYSEIDVLVIPSLSPETFSLVAREALSLGKPVIASKIGALPEIVIDNINGFLFEPGNKQELAAIMQKIVSKPETLTQLGRSERPHIVTINEHVAAIEEIYSQVRTVSSGPDTPK